MARVAFTTLGCKVNQSETDSYARQFSASGHHCVPFESEADVYVVNTCTVTHVADRKSRQILNQTRRRNPGALVVATGCYASIVGELLADDRTLVLRNRHKVDLVQLVERRLGLDAAPDCPPLRIADIDVEKYRNPNVAGSESAGYARQRAMVKVQDGCDSHCTYCIIPRARGRSRSVNPDTTVNRVQELSQEGHAEAVITGVDLGSYGDDDKAFPDLGGLIRRILVETDIKRVHLSSLEPADFKEEWLELWADERMCRHLHVPLQSGSISVLERMERKYTPETFASMLEKCRRAIPEITITTDVMSGFPGETEKEFEQGLDFIGAMRFDGMHVFKYSRRSGTKAAHLPDDVRDEVKQERSRILRQEASLGLERLRSRHQGRRMVVVWEDRHEGVARGMTDTNVRIYARWGEAGTTSQVLLGDTFMDGLWGEPDAVVPASLPLVAV